MELRFNLSMKYMRRSLLVLLFVSLISSILLISYNNHDKQTNSDYLILYKDETISLSNSVQIIDAVVLISTGNYAKTTITDESLNALRFNSALSISIPIYVLTDHLSCINSTKIKNHKLNDLNIFLLEIPDSKDNYMTQVSYKMGMFDFLPSFINTILYIDIDIIAQATFDENILSTFTSEKYKNSNCSLIIQQGRYHTEKLSGGTFVANRQQSMACLTEWRAKVLSGKYRRDQHALYNTKSCMDSICTLNVVKWSRNIWNFVNFKTPPLIHYTSDSHGTKQQIADFCEKANFSLKLYCYLRYIYPPLFLEIQSKNC